MYQTNINWQVREFDAVCTEHLLDNKIILNLKLQDEYALRSHTRAKEATDAGLLTDVLTYKPPGKKILLTHVCTGTYFPTSVTINLFNYTMYLIEIYIYVNVLQAEQKL